jgi:hypothetical protein
MLPVNLVLVSGGRAKERDLVERVTCWCVNKLMPRYRTLEINVTIKKIPVYGYCLEGDSKREFDIEIKKGLNLYDIISTVCHEMGHVRQYAKGQLRHRTDGTHLWKSDPNLCEDTDYENTPWEKEAFALERELALECFQNLQYNFYHDIGD